MANSCFLYFQDAANDQLSVDSDRINAIRRIFDSELKDLLEQLSNLEENDQNEELKAQYDDIFGDEENIEW